MREVEVARREQEDRRLLVVLPTSSRRRRASRSLGASLFREVGRVRMLGLRISWLFLRM